MGTRAGLSEEFASPGAAGSSPRRRPAHPTQERSAALAEPGLAHDEALAAARARSAFLAGAAHELRTPLNAVIGFAEVLTDPELVVDDATRDEFLRDILGAGRHLQQLIDDLMDLCKLDAGTLNLRAEDFSVPVAISAVQAVVRSVVERRRQRLHVEVDPAVGAVHHDPARFKQVLVSLISHACRRTREAGVVRLTAQQDELGWLLVAVSGSAGSSEGATQPHAVEPILGHGQPVNSTRVQDRSDGLGMALARRLAHLMGGVLFAGPDPGQGSTLTLRLPPRWLSPDGEPHAAGPAVDTSDWPRALAATPAASLPALPATPVLPGAARP
jgi:signal transduction histidine kinase